MSSEESITESVKQALKERVANPLWGYIILSWVGFNWKSIAIMCLSEASVVTRIQQITSTEDFYLKTLCYPVGLGFILATFFPYFSNLVTLLQIKATAWRARQKVEAENLEESARLTSKLKIEKQKNLIEREKEDTSNLKSQAEKLATDVDNLNAEIGKLENQKKHLSCELDFLQQDVMSIEDLISKLVADECSIDEYRSELKKLVSPEIMMQARNRKNLPSLFGRKI